ncbi:MAG: YkgJ family cysteine cluster protein [Chitinispirillaceae bacterium]
MQQMTFSKKEPLSVPLSAVKIHNQIIEVLKELRDLQVPDPLDVQFRNRFENVLELFDEYQKETIRANGYQMSCFKGCAWCCCHWVEDVNSFEAQIIANYIKKNLLHQKEDILKKCKDDLTVLKNLDRVVNEKLERVQCRNDLDATNLLLSAFYQLERPCPLLGHEGACSVYPVRPLTCRIYMSFSDPSRCSPENINDGEIVTYLLDLEEKSNELLDELHFRFCRYEGNTGLRSVLIRYLEE